MDDVDDIKPKLLLYYSLKGEKGKCRPRRPRRPEKSTPHLKDPDR